MTPSRPSTGASSSRSVRSSTRGGGNSGDFGGADIVHSDYELAERIKQLENEERNRLRFVNSLVDKLPRMRKRTRFDVLRANNNGLDRDPRRTENLFKLSTLWSDMERAIFIEKFLQFPKQFRKIASYLANKTTADAIQYYYDTKKSHPYKLLLRRQQQQERKSSQSTGDDGYKSWTLTTEELTRSGAAVPCVEDRETGDIMCFDNTYHAYRVDPKRIHLPLSREEQQRRRIEQQQARQRAQVPAQQPLEQKQKQKQKQPLPPQPQQPQQQQQQQQQKPEQKRKTQHVAEPAAPPQAKKQKKSESVEVKKEMETDQKRSEPAEQWTEKDKAAFMQHLPDVGKDWHALAARIESKTPDQVEQYYLRYRHRFGLDDMLDSD